MPKMKQNCRYCRHFEPKGIMSGSTNWGLCIISAKEEIMGNNKESPFFRWEDDTCENFKAREKSSDLQSRRDKA